MREKSEVSCQAESSVDREELAEAVAAAHGAHEMVEELHSALLEEREKVARLKTELGAARATRLFRYEARLRAMYAARRHSG
jgi:hypothetical protein